MNDPAAASVTPQPPPCPFCGGERTEIMSLFGSHASLTTCWCADCRSPFEFLRWREAAAQGGNGGGTTRIDAPKRHTSARQRNMDPAPGVE